MSFWVYFGKINIWMVIYFFKFQMNIFFLSKMLRLTKNKRLNGKIKFPKRDLFYFFCWKKETFKIKKKRPKRDPKIGLGLLRDPGLPERDLSGSSAKDYDTNQLTPPPTLNEVIPRKKVLLFGHFPKGGGGGGGDRKDNI